MWQALSGVEDRRFSEKNISVTSIDADQLCIIFTFLPPRIVEVRLPIIPGLTALESIYGNKLSFGSCMQEFHKKLTFCWRFWTHTCKMRKQGKNKLKKCLQNSFVVARNAIFIVIQEHLLQSCNTI